VILVFGLLAAAPAFAARRAVHSPEIDTARQLIAEAEFDRALAEIGRALAHEHNTDLMLGTLYELQGTAYLYLGHEDKARESFERLLQAVPDFELAAGTSPKLRSLFEQVKSDLARSKLQPVTVAHEPPPRAAPGRRLDIDARMSAMPAGARARLYYRRAGTESYSSTFFAELEGDLKRAQVPAFELPEQASDYALEYYIEVADGAGRRLAGAGNALEPLLVKVAAAQALSPDPSAASEERWYQKWWIWAIAGGVAAGAGAAVAVPLLLDNQATLPVTVKVQQ
jgi:tetratricopeptide (TPR) repeat protein